MTAKNISINRDDANDVIYVIKNGADKSKTINISVTSDILLRLNPKTKEVVGLTIEDFSKVLPELKDCKEYVLMEQFEAIIDFLNASHLAKAKQ